jgi:hypothetical protein
MRRFRLLVPEGNQLEEMRIVIESVAADGNWRGGGVQLRAPGAYVTLSGCDTRCELGREVAICRTMGGLKIKADCRIPSCLAQKTWNWHYVAPSDPDNQSFFRLPGVIALLKSKK